MKKLIYLFFIPLLFNCKSVDDWNIEPVLLDGTVEQALTYITDQRRYLDLLKTRETLDIKNSLTNQQLDKLLKIEKSIALSSKKVANSWFDFYLQLRQDPGFMNAYRGHYYFRKGIDALTYSDKMKKIKNECSLKDSKTYRDINILEGECQLAIGEIVANNMTLLEPDIYYKELKKLYKSMD